MLFNSYEFIFLFLPVAFTVFYLIAGKNHNGALAWLALVSLFSYGYWSLYALPILIGSIIFNYSSALFLANSETRNRKLLLFFAITSNLLVLAFFKYSNFFIDNTNALRSLLGLATFDYLDVILPIGISFFTFTQMAFLMDSYHGKVKERNFLHYIAFVTFFPYIFSGPIIHHRQVMPQFSSHENSKLSSHKIMLGITIFVIGLSKKLLIADNLSSYANLLFDGTKMGEVPHFMISWLGSLAYTFQLYFDFSGYSDMAVGLALFFGVLIPINFNAPFKATNIIDFWQRWHISLTKYIGEYLYNPLTLRFTRLGFDRGPFIDTLYSLILPTIITFLIIGIWHGPSWTYVLFGGMHGLFLIINHLWRRLKPSQKKLNPIKTSLNWLITFLSVNASFVMFRSENISIAGEIYKGMLGINGLNLSENYSGAILKDIVKGIWQVENMPIETILQSFLLLLLGFALVLFFPSSSKYASLKQSDSKLFFVSSIWGPIALAFLFVLSVMQLGKTSQFLYFQF